MEKDTRDTPVEIREGMDEQQPTLGEGERLDEPLRLVLREAGDARVQIACIVPHQRRDMPELRGMVWADLNITATPAGELRREFDVGQTAEGGLDVAGGMGRRACAASSIARSTGSCSKAMLSATLRGMLCHRRRHFSTSGRLRQCRMTSSQFMRSTIVHQQGVCNGHYSRGALIRGAQQGFQPGEREGAMTVKQRQNALGPTRASARVETGGGRGQIEASLGQPMKRVVGSRKYQRRQRVAVPDAANSRHFIIGGLISGTGVPGEPHLAVMGTDQIGQKIEAIGIESHDLLQRIG